MREPLLIGQAPGPNTDPALPLHPLPKTSTGGRLAELIGMSPVDYHRSFERINLLQDFPGQHKRDDKFPLGKAKIAARAIVPLLRERVVILVGRNVATAFGLLEEPFHVWMEDTQWCQAMAIVPHPSGRNHWYNKPDNRLEAQEFWKEAVARHVPDSSQLPSMFSRRMQQASLMQARQELST